jgi:hypothetical protein
MKDLTILVDTDPCRPTDMLSALGAAGVAVVAGCLFPRLGGRVAHITVDDEDADRVGEAIVGLAGVVADQRDCVVVEPPANAEKVLASLADAGLAVSIAYFGSSGQLVVGTADSEAARTVLGL